MPLGKLKSKRGARSAHPEVLRPGWDMSLPRQFRNGRKETPPPISKNPTVLQAQPTGFQAFSPKGLPSWLRRLWLHFSADPEGLDNKGMSYYVENARAQVFFELLSGMKEDRPPGLQAASAEGRSLLKAHLCHQTHA